MGLGFFDLDERTSSLKAGHEFDAFVDSVQSHVMFNTVIFISFLGLGSLTGSLFDSGLGLSDEFLIVGDFGLQSVLLRVESVLEMGSSNTESDLGVSKSDIDFLVDLEMFGLGPSVFFLFTSDFEVEIFNKVFESSDELAQWAARLNLKVHESDSDLSPTGFFEVLELALEGKISRRFDLHGAGDGQDNSKNGKIFH